MKAKLYSVLLLALVAVWGCQPGDKTSGTSDSIAGTNANTNSTNTQTATQEPKPPEPAIPDTLKTDAYRYYGLSNLSPMKQEVSSNIGGHAEGTVTVKFMGMKGERAIFMIEREGELAAQLGTDTLSLEKDGLYVVKSSLLGDTRNVEMPAKMTPGATWTNVGKLKPTTGGTIDQKVSYKVVGEQSVTTPVGTQTALYVTSKGTMKTPKGNFTMDAQIWYVKDKGLVKSIVSLKEANKPAQVITIQETK